MEWLVETLRKYPELAIFVTLGLGYWVGGLRIGNFSLGAVTGTLLVGVIVGQAHIEISSTVKSVFFLMFLFALGYGVGPQFFRGLKGDGLPQVFFAVIICVICLLVTWGCAVVAGFDAGTAAGLLSGAQTISAVMGVGTDTINGLDLSAEQKKAMINHIPVAYAVTYIFGTAGTAWILASLGPKLLGIDLAASCKEYEAKMSGSGDSTGLSGYRMFTARAYRLKAELAGRSVTDVEALFGADRVFVKRVRRGGAIVEPEPGDRLGAGDIVALTGRHEALVENAVRLVGEEIEDRELLSVPVDILEVVLTNKDVAGKTVGDLAASEVAKEFARGVYLRRVVRGGTDMPLNAGLKLDRGDHLFLVGTAKDVARIASILGYPDRPTTQTDMTLVGFGIFLGGIFGTLAFKAGGVPISLSTSGGALIAGLICGWLRSTNPKFGRISDGAQWLMSSVGLTPSSPWSASPPGRASSPACSSSASSSSSRASSPPPCPW